MTADAAPETREVLLATLRSMWPGASVALERRPRGGHGVVTLTAVPNASTPRLLVPHDNRRAASGAMHRYNAAISIRETVTRFAAGAGLRVGAAGLLRDHFVIDTTTRPAESAGAEGASLQDHLSGVLGTSVTFSLGIGNPRVNRKPVLQIFDSAGRSIAFAKVAVTADSAGDVRAEADALATLSGSRWHEIEVPELLHAGAWNDAFVLVMTALETSPLQRHGSQIPVTAMNELASHAASAPCQLDSTPWWQRIVACEKRIDDPNLQRSYGAACRRLLQVADGAEWPVGSWHGDWTPWNMAWTKGRVRLWDWERFERGVPAGLDRFHFAVNTRLRRHGISIESIHGALGELIEPGNRSERTLAAAYLLAVSSRYVESLRRDRGELIRSQAEITLAALEEWLH